ANQGNVAGDFTVTINWGDGATSAGALVFTGNSGGLAHYNVTGSHTYADEGSDTFTLTVADDGPGQSPLQVTNVATVADADNTLSLQSNPITPTEGTAFSGVLATW